MSIGDELEVLQERLASPVVVGPPGAVAVAEDVADGRAHLATEVNWTNR
jgi:hypothetical protein